MVKHGVSVSLGQSRRDDVKRVVSVSLGESRRDDVKRVVSVSLGESRRDACAEIDLLGTRVRLERRGVDGDMRAMKALLAELDGKVDALGIGGTDLGLRVAGRWYPLYEIANLARVVRHTPVVDGTGLKCTLERRAAGIVDGLPVRAQRRVLFPAGADRWGLVEGFAERGYELLFGDLGFGLGLPIPIRNPATTRRLAAVIMPIIGRLPFRWLYPTGSAQSEWRPRFASWYAWAGVIAGDCHYIKRHRPARLDGKVVVTNTTTPTDVDVFRDAGAAWLVTTTPRLDGRTFGTNVFEAALIAARGLGRALTDPELDAAIDELGLKPEASELIRA